MKNDILHKKNIEYHINVISNKHIKLIITIIAKKCKKVITFGNTENADVYGYNIRKEGMNTVFNVRTQYFDEESRSFIGPKRIWLKNSDIPGLAMTRSFGDLIAHSVGVICEPEIGFYWFRGCEKFVIVASDGVWEFIDSEESVHIVKQFYENGMDASGAVNALVQEAYNRWKREEDIIDDITALVVFFD